MRLAVGASRWQIVRLLLSESLHIASIGGTLGVLLAFWAVAAFKAIGASVIARIDEIGVDVPVLIFSAGTIFIATVLFGLLPAWKSAHINVEPALKSGARGSGHGLARVRKTLIVSELTLALMLLIGASLLVKSFWKLMDVNPGFDPTHVQTFRLRLPDWKYDNPEMAIRAVKELRRRIGELPGVIRVGITSGIPLGRSDEESYWLEGQPEPANELQWPAALSFFVDENLCRTLGIPLLAGRMLSERDTDNTPPVVLVDDEFVPRKFRRRRARCVGATVALQRQQRTVARDRRRRAPRRALWVGGTRSRRSLPAVAASEVDDGQSRFSLPASNGFRGENRRRTELVSACDQNRAAQDRQRSAAGKCADA